MYRDCLARVTIMESKMTSYTEYLILYIYIYTYILKQRAQRYAIAVYIIYFALVEGSHVRPTLRSRGRALF